MAKRERGLVNNVSDHIHDIAVTIDNNTHNLISERQRSSLTYNLVGLCF